MHQEEQPRRTTTYLEWLTGAVLSGVVFALAWMIVVAYQPAWLRLPSTGMEIAMVVCLLGLALLLVSVLALLHTRN